MLPDRKIFCPTTVGLRTLNISVASVGVEQGGVDVLDGHAVFVAVLQGPCAEVERQVEGMSA